MITAARLMAGIEGLVARNFSPYLPHWGWHDDHRAADGTPDYLPALMQVRAETAQFWIEMEAAGILLDAVRSCLQLGMGECGASHDVLCLAFPRVVTIDFGVVRMSDGDLTIDYPGVDIRSDDALSHARRIPSYDLLMLDASHTYDGVAEEYRRYAPLVRSGGVIAFHDALRRPSHPEVEVWKFLSELDAEVRVIGNEVGVAWTRVP